MQVITEEQYQAWYDMMGKKYLISPRVIRFIRNHYKVKCPDAPYAEARLAMIDYCKGQIVDMNRTFRSIQLDTIHAISRKITGLDVSARSIHVMEDNVKQLAGHMDKLGYRRSILKFLSRKVGRDDETFKDIIATEITPL